MHGEASLAIAAEDNELAFELRSPLANIVGFEHDPRTDEERTALATAAADLLMGASLFLPNNEAGCSFDYVQSSLGDGEDAHHEGEDAHHHDDHAADEHHDEHGDHHEEAHEGHDDHHDDHGEHADHDDHGHGDVHADMTATYMFSCSAPDRLNSIYVGLFDQFSGMETIEATFLSETVQTAADLTPSSPEFDLK